MQLRMLAILALMASMLISFQPATPVTTAATTASVAQEAGVLFSDEFEAASLGANWSVETADQGVVELDTDNPQSGTQSVFIGQYIEEDDTSASLTLAIDLTGQTDVSLDYWVRRSGAGEHLRVSISDDDGASWTEIQNLDNTAQSFSHQLIDLANVAGENGLTLNNQFRIRFAYFAGGLNDVGDANDGMVIDDLRLTQRAPAASFPLAAGFEGGTFAQGFYPQSSYNGIVELDPHNPQSGAQSVFIGQRVAGSYASASLTLDIDLAGQTDVFLDYWVRDNGAGEDLRVEISDNNGTSWTEIRNLDNTGQSLSHHLINLAEIAERNGLTLNDKFRIRFAYFAGGLNDIGDANDGMVIDNLRLTQRARIVASFPLADESFEAATFAQGFYPQSTYNGVVELHTHNPHSGAQSVFMGQRLAGDDTTASLILAIDLAGQTDVSLDYWVRDNGADEDLRVSISDDDGANWTEIRNLDDTGQSFTYDLIDLDDIAAQNGLTLNDQFRIRFAYFAGGLNDVGDVNDGMVIDDLRVSGSSSSSSFTVYMPLLQR